MSSESLQVKALRGAILLLPAVLVVAFLASGLVSLLELTFHRGTHVLQETLGRPDYVDTIIRTHVISAMVTLTCIALGYPLALYIARTKMPRSKLLLLVILPWLVSIVVRCLGWITLLGPAGLINSILGEMGVGPWSLMFNTLGIVVATAHVLLPFMVLSVLTSVLQVHESLLEASNSLGVGDVRTFFSVTLPLTLPGVLSGSVLVYLSSCGSVITPLLMGGLRQKMVGTQIYTDTFTFFDFEKAGSMAVLLVVTGMAVVIPLTLLEKHLTRRISVGKEMA